MKSREFLNKFVVVFVDDILIFSRSKEEQAQHLKEVMDALHAHQLKAKFSKCHFWREEVRFLGHVVSKEGLAMDPAKVVAVQDWKVPQNATKVRSFLGLAGFTRKFIKDFTKISAPLTRLTKKNLTFAWNLDCDIAFQRLKRALTTAPVLTLPDGSKMFTVYTDACGTRIGVVLMQEGKVVAYGGRQLKVHEKNYPTHDLGLATIVFALKS